MVASEVTIEEKRAELDAVLRSKEFSRSPALARLLEYLCEKTFTGRVHEIKEFSIATEVFGRGEDFSEKRDSLVRVEVHRLRRKLQSYYDGDGSGRPFRIVIRPGNYQPDFERVAGAEPEPGEPEPVFEAGESESNAVAVARTPDRPVEQRARWWIVSGALALIVTAISVAQFHSAKIRVSASAAAASTREIPPASNVPIPVRILAGSETARVIDRFGNEWGPDRYFSGGYGNFLKFGDQERSVRRPTILGVADQTPFRTFRAGDFSYAIPLRRAQYEMRLYFSEVVFGISDSGDGADNQRVFDVTQNGSPLLRFHDIYSDAGGPDTADVHVFENIAPASDGFLHLTFHSLREAAWLNAIELIPNSTGQPLPTRIVAQNASFTDRDGSLWGSDQYFVGGRATSDGKTVSGAADPEMFAGVRYGHFSYRIPAAPGKYMLRLYFAETFFGPGNRGEGGVGSRVFNVYCSGTEILRNFDIFKDAGQNHALVKTFHGISPSPSGRIDITFEPVVNYAAVYAIEIVPERTVTVF